MCKASILITSFIFMMCAQSLAHDPPATHGMLMVGTSKIYLSHLPMFHSPHDYQVLLEVSVNPEALKGYTQSLQNSTETVYTLVPEVFVLPDMIQHPQPFQAKIYRGHFERGGTLIADKVRVNIEKVLFFKKFVVGAAAPMFGNYLLFGNSDEQFLAHAITAKPDFDKVLRVSVEPNALPALKAQGILGLVFQGLPNAKPLTAPAAGMAVIASTKQAVKIKIQSNIYFETGDLSF